MVKKFDGKYSVRVTRGRRVTRRKTDSGRAYSFFFGVGGGKYLRFDTALPDGLGEQHRKDLEFFSRDDLFEIKKGHLDNAPGVAAKPAETSVGEQKERVKGIVKRGGR